jgi:thymidylate synthase
MDAVKEQLQRTPKELPTIEISNWKDIWSWKYTDFIVNNYNPDPSIKAPIAV